MAIKTTFLLSVPSIRIPGVRLLLLEIGPRVDIPVNLVELRELEFPSTTPSGISLGLVDTSGVFKFSCPVGFSLGTKLSKVAQYSVLDRGVPAVVTFLTDK